MYSQAKVDEYLVLLNAAGNRQKLFPLELVDTSAEYPEPSFEAASLEGPSLEAQ